MRRWRAIATVVPATAALGLAVAACGGSHDRRLPTAGANVTGGAQVPRLPLLRIDVSLPLTGPDAPQGHAALSGIELAFKQAEGYAGEFRLKLRIRDDAGSAGSWETGQVASNALDASTSPSTILYIGDLASGATQVSSAILSAAGIPQVSPGSPAVKFAPAPASPPAPSRQAESSTLLRLGPSNRAQASTILGALSRVVGCTRVALLPGPGLDAADLASEIQQHISAYPTLKRGLLPLPQSASGHEKSALPLSQWLPMLEREGANCGVYAGSPAGGGIDLIGRLHQYLVQPAMVVASSGVCTSSWASPASGGEPASLAPYLECAAPGPSLNSIAGRTFVRTYKTAYRTTPDPMAAYGYQAMELGIDAIASASTRGDQRSAVLTELKGTPQFDTPIGTFTFGSQGQLSGQGDVYRLYAIRNGRLVPTAGKTGPGVTGSGAATGGSPPGGSTSTETTTTQTTTTATTTTPTATTPTATTPTATTPTTTTPGSPTSAG